MGELSKLFDTSDFPARWHCGNWTTAHGWTHIISDSLIFAAYLTIPLLILLIAWRKGRAQVPVPFRRLAGYFVAFIVCCGITHLNEAIIFYEPVYRWAGLVKAVTALVSWGTVFALVPAVPEFVALRTPAELKEEVQRATETIERGRMELERSNEELESFASAASHDLKAPLRAVQHAATWIEEDLSAKELSDDMKENLELLRNRTARMEQLLDGLLDYARVGRESPSMELFDVGDVISDIVALLGDEAKRAVRIDGNPPMILGRRVLFERVVSNLVSNAIKHNPNREVSVIIRCEEEDGAYCFAVEDDGVGIEPRFHERIFEVFETLHPRDEREAVGMGLAFVKKIVTREGGRVSVISGAGRGAKFQFTWPNRMTPSESSSVAQRKARVGA